MNISNFIKTHKTLCTFTLGLAIIGYLGTRVVRWIIEKCQKTKKIDTVFQSRLNTPLTKPADSIFYGNVQSANDATLVCLPSHHDSRSKSFIENFIKQNFRKGDLILVEAIPHSVPAQRDKTEGIPDDGKEYRFEGWEPPVHMEFIMLHQEWLDQIKETHKDICGLNPHRINAIMNRLIDMISLHQQSKLMEHFENQETKTLFENFLSEVKIFFQIMVEENEASRDEAITRIFNKMGDSLSQLYDSLYPHGAPLSISTIKKFIANIFSIYIQRINPFNLIHSYTKLSSSIFRVLDINERNNCLAERMEHYLEEFKRNGKGQRLFVIAGSGHFKSLDDYERHKPYRVLKKHPQTLICSPREFHCHTVMIDEKREIHPIKKCKVTSLKPQETQRPSGSKE